MKYLKALIGAVLLIALDQWTKYMVLLHVKPIDSIPLIPGDSFLYLSRKPGSCMGESAGTSSGSDRDNSYYPYRCFMDIFPDTGHEKIQMASLYRGAGHRRRHR